MTRPETILNERPDLDTLGGRIGRAREASGLSMEEVAIQLGVTQDTWDNWEADREEPRANRLAMMAGFLNVSPSWLLFGIGESPSTDNYPELVIELSERLDSLEEAHAQTGEAISMIRETILRLAENVPEADES